MSSYQDFIKNKVNFDYSCGFNIEKEEINPLLRPHQGDIVQWAIKGGRRAIFAAFGLGKSFMQLEILRIIHKYEGGNLLIIAPLGVRKEFKNDAKKLGIEITFIRRTDEINSSGIYITNYESVRDGRLDINQFVAVTLDEASCLRSYGSLTFQTFLTLFSSIKYRFVATATPSPNRYKELIHYAGFLGVMDTGQALTRFFKRDSTKANNLTLYPHKENEFWFWINSWAIFLQKPSDLGYSDEGYSLPKLHVHYHEVKSETKLHANRDGQYEMFPNAAVSIGAAAQEKKNSLNVRIKKLVEILETAPSDNFLIWHDQEIERHEIERNVKGVVSIFGKEDIDIREEKTASFADGHTQYLASKPILSGSGCNFQYHCHNAVFLGIGFKFNDFIQSIHRIYRFLQEKECHIHIIYANTEKKILEVLMEKWTNHNIMVEKMAEIIKKYGLSGSQMALELQRSIGVERIEVKGDNFIAANNDCVEETRSMETNSIDLIHTSIPFANHYEYSPSYNDFGNTTDNDHFWRQMDFLTPELLRVLRPGRVYACHVKDRINFGNVTGYGMPTVSPFHAETIAHCIKHGFVYFGMITVVTDVVRENNQTYRLGWSEQCKDGSKMGVGSPEYILLFRKLPTDTSRAYADVPVVKSKEEYTRAQWQVDAHAFWRSSGERSLTADEMAKYPPDIISKVFTKFTLDHLYDYEHHISLGKRLDAKGSLPSTFMTLAPGSYNQDVWHDVNRMLSLNGAQSKRGLNSHICPLQFDIVDRIINRFTNKGEWVYDPFGGLMTVPYRAVLAGRKGRAAELSTPYFMDGVQYLKAAEHKIGVPSLFDFEKGE